MKYQLWKTVPAGDFYGTQLTRTLYVGTFDTKHEAEQEAWKLRKQGCKTIVYATVAWGNDRKENSR